MRRALLLVLGCALLSGCKSKPRPDYMEPPNAGRLEVIDTLPDFLSALRKELETGRVTDAWAAYDARQATLFEAAQVNAEDPGSERVTRLVASTDAVLGLVDAFEQRATSELQGVERGVGELIGPPPKTFVVFAVTLDEIPVFTGRWQDRPLILLNARHPDLAPVEQRRATMARELFRLVHVVREPDSPSLGPLATRVFRDGAASFATRQLVPDAPEHHVLGVAEKQLGLVRSRERAVAKELLASFDSASEVEVARFFDPALKDPIVPRGAGALLADKIFQRLAIELQSTTKPLQLDATEFARRARQQLEAIAAGK